MFEFAVTIAVTSAKSRKFPVSAADYFLYNITPKVL